MTPNSRWAAVCRFKGELRAHDPVVVAGRRGSSGGDVPPGSSTREEHRVHGRRATGPRERVCGRNRRSYAGGIGPARVESGWHSLGAMTRAVYRVDFVAREPAGDWRVMVDGESGAPLFRLDLRAYASAAGSAFEVSPVETTADLCPVSGGGT